MGKLSWSKWTKYKVLRKSKVLIPHLPKTYWMKKPSLWRLLNKFEEVIVKPSGSYGGNGVLLIRSLGDLEFEIQAGPNKKSISGQANVWDYVKTRTSKNFIVQRRISLATVNRRPFDLRVMVQRLRNSPWEVTGKLAKVAGKGYIITNMRRSHGSILPVKKAINRSQLKGLSTNDLLYNIDQVALLTANQLKKFYPKVRTIGIDMGLDESGRIWIIEANFNPSKSLFLKLKNQSMYRKIKSFGK